MRFARWLLFAVAVTWSCLDGVDGVSTHHDRFRQRLLDHEAGLQAQLQQTHAIPPLLPLCMSHPPDNCYTPAEARATVRGESKSDIDDLKNAGLFRNYFFSGTGLNGDLVGNGLILMANFTIGTEIKTKSGHTQAIGDLPKQYNDMLWNHKAQGGEWTPAGTRFSRHGTVYNLGHIWARSFGGSNLDPINFFPLHHLANQEGRWKRAEQIADALNKYVTKQTPPAQVHVKIRFDYPGPGPDGPSTNPYIPGGGTYSIFMASWEFDRVFKNVKIADLHADVQLWLRKSSTVLSFGQEPQVSQRLMVIPWLNKGDYAISPTVLDKIAACDRREDCVAEPVLF